jgi:cytochrome c oxidase subunit 2
MALRTKGVVFVAALAVCFVLAGRAGAQPEGEVDMANGEELYQLCAQCHGAEGHGNQVYLAPAIAGFDQWYVEMQLNSFRTGLRGLHFDDISGMRMRPMSLTLRTPEDLRDVAAWVAAMPKSDPQPTLAGNAAAGQALYTLCAACHGPSGEGIEAMKAPALNHTNDWYLVDQLTKYKAGVRGTRAGDIYGVLMGPTSPMALTLTTDQAVRDVVAYIMTLGQPAAGN